MCGILSQVSQRPLDFQRFQVALDSLQSRGPDGRGSWLCPDGRVALGHRRLAIVDPEGGQQPCQDETGEIVAVVNGEFYGHALLRLQLMGQGVRFRSHSDSELLVHLYRHYGVNCLSFLRGEFAWILYDTRQQRLLAARDGYGIKPLVYLVRGEELWIGSKVRPLRALGARLHWDPDHFYFASATQYMPSQHTLFQDIHQVPPGHLLSFHRGQLELSSYWNYPKFGEGSEVSNPEEEFAHLLDECVRLRLPAQKVACQLSGGIDSSAVLALAKEASAEVTAFHVSFPATPLDESEAASRLAEDLGVPLEVVHLGEVELLESLQAATLASEGLAINAHLSAKYCLQQRISQLGFKVCLTGEGADEVLLGYPHYRCDLEPWRLEELERQNIASRGIMLDQQAGLELAAVQATLGHCPFFLRAKAALGKRLQSLLRSEFVDAQRGRDCYQEMVLDPQLQGLEPVEQSAWLWNRSALANYILHTLGDGCEMAHGVEGRLPFLDIQLSQFLARVPLHWKIRLGQEKFLLRQSLQHLLPAWMLQRPKHPFMAPPLTGLAPHLQEWAREVEHPFVDPHRLRQRLTTLSSLSSPEQHLWQPVLLWVLTSYYLESWLR